MRVNAIFADAVSQGSTTVSGFFKGIKEWAVGHAPFMNPV